MTDTKMSQARLYIILATMNFGVFLGALDGTVVTSLLSHIASDLKELSRIEWIVTGYLVACAAFQPLYGKVSDIFGRKVMLLFCNTMFGVGCAICGMANDLETLVAGRIISGIGGGGIMTLTTIAVSDLVPLRMRGMLQGVGNICYGLGAGSGGVLGGWVSNKYGWKMAFTCQVPLIGLSIVLLAIFFEDKKRDEVKGTETEPLINGDDTPTKFKSKFRAKVQRIDFYGAASLIGMLLLLMIALSTGGRQIPWSSPLIPLLLSLSVAMLGLFVYVELYIAKEPVVPVRLFSSRTVLASSLCNFFSTCSVFSLINFIPILFASVNGMDERQVGRKLVANFIGVATGSLGAGIYMRSTGKYYTIAVLSPVLVLIAIANGLRFDQNTTAWQHAFSLLLFGFGYASMLTTTLIALIASVPHHFQATTTSIQYAFRSTGSVLGVAISSAIFKNVLKKELYANVHGDGAADAISRVLDSVEAIRKVPIQFQQAIIFCFQHAIHSVLIFAFICSVLATLCSGAMKEYSLDGISHGGSSAAAEEEQTSEEPVEQSA